MKQGVIYALLAASLFGASTPFAKVFLSHVSPLLLAGLFYFGSGLGLCFLILIRKFSAKTKSENNKILTKDIPWLIAATACGGLIAPILLMFGISLVPSSSASILLNLETILTVLIAWFVFKENFDWRVIVGICLTISANILMSLQESQFEGIPWGSILIILSCLCWALDNNFTRKISNNDALTISTIKGSAAGSLILILAVILGQKFPDLLMISQILIVGFFGYGLSLVLFVLALRNLGAAKTGAFFSIAPICGAALSLLVLQENPSLIFWIAAILMAIGIVILSYPEFQSK